MDRKGLTLDIEESLYFRQEQRVKDMINISLNPEITIQKYDEYVSIRGVLELTGEYVMKTEEEDQEQEEDYSRQYIKNIEEGTNDYNLFSHLIPVEISVPLYRVNNFEEMTVEVIQFDYEMEKNDHLLVNAELNILGIDPFEEEEKGIKEEFREDNFDLDMKIEEIKEDSLDTNQAEKRKRKEEKELLPSLDELNARLRQDSLLEEKEETKIIQKEQEDLEEDSQEIEAREIEEDSDFHFLSSLFKTDEEQKYSKIRLCIVQSDDTIETIAKRFEVPTLQILKHNELEDSDLSPGELLYIPKHHKKTN